MLSNHGGVVEGLEGVELLVGKAPEHIRSELFIVEFVQRANIDVQEVGENPEKAFSKDLMNCPTANDTHDTSNFVGGVPTGISIRIHSILQVELVIVITKVEIAESEKLFGGEFRTKFLPRDDLGVGH